VPYTGNLALTARFPSVNLSSDIAPDHAAGKVPDDNDLWGGQTPAGPGPDYGSPGLWVGVQQDAPQAPWRPDPMGHMAPDPPRLDPPRVGWVAAQQVAAREMMRTHGATDADLYLSLPRQPDFDFVGQANSVVRQEGLTSWEPGLSGPLARGRNSYAQNNPPTEVYGGAGMRLGYDTITYGFYRTPIPMQMQYHLRAVAGQRVQFPVDTPQVTPNMRTSFSTGTQIARPVLHAIPRLYASPSATSISDATMAAAPAVDPGGFASDGWG
jgi:hypothetical protein